MGELANCPQCGELFVKGAISVCQKCYQDEEKKFEKVYKFIRKRKNRTATMYEVASETGVEESLITKWVKEKRIHPSQMPNFNYPCQSCGNPISEGKLCPGCSEKLRQDITGDAEPQLEKDNKITYYNVNKNQ